MPEGYEQDSDYLTLEERPGDTTSGHREQVDPLTGKASRHMNPRQAGSAVPDATRRPRSTGLPRRRHGRTK